MLWPASYSETLFLSFTQHLLNFIYFSVFILLKCGYLKESKTEK